jgi:hypothetical protein
MCRRLGGWVFLNFLIFISIRLDYTTGHIARFLYNEGPRVSFLDIEGRLLSGTRPTQSVESSNGLHPNQK